MKRRDLLRAGCLGGLVTAGCLARDRGAQEQGQTSRSPTGTATDTVTDTPSPTRTATPEPPSTAAMLDAMADWRNWESMDGTASLAPALATPSGRPALEIQATPSDRRGGASFEFAAPVDFTSQFPVVDLRWERPTFDSNVTFNLRLVDVDGNGEVHGAPVDEGIQGEEHFTTLPFGYKYTPNDPVDLTQVVRVDLYYFVNGSDPVRCWLDDLRLYASERDRGVVMIHFDDSHASIHSEGYQYLRQHDVPATLNVIRHELGNENRLTRTQVDELANEGWDVTAHPQNRVPLTEASEETIARYFREELQYLRTYGYEDRVMTWPHNSYDGRAMRLAQQYFDLCFAGGYGLTAPAITARYTMPRRSADDPAIGRLLVDRAERRGGMATLIYHTIGEGLASRSDFREVVDYVRSADVDVVTPSDLLEESV